MEGSGRVQTSILIFNLHCPSCVATIDRVLQGLIPKPFKISTSIISHSAVVEHSPTLHVKAIIQALVDVGFELQNVTSNALEPWEDENVVQSPRAAEEVPQLQRWLSSSLFGRDVAPAQRDAHTKYCSHCAIEGVDERDVPDAIKPNKRSVKRARLAVSGMTCSSCVNTITESLNEKPWIEKAIINLISNSATVDFIPPGSADAIIEAIEDLGYDAIVDSVDDTVQTVSQTQPAISSRTVQFKIDGMHCPRCPARILASVSSFGDKLTVLKNPTIEKPILELSYTPVSQDLTIRSILHVLSDVDEQLRPSIYHPPTLEEQSRKMYHRHLRSLLWRLILTSIIAIPTFILGIVFMTLVPESNKVRKSLMKPLGSWSGRASKLDFALFILATPVYLFAADVFHRRAMKEIWSMWRLGSKTPMLYRFAKFGSMDMLTSLGTSIAYISSLAVMILNALHEPDTTQDSSANASYFDSVVFLTLFLLMGRLLEMFSKSKAGDAVSALGSLRPNEALLIETTNGTASANGSSSSERRVKRIPVDLLEVGDVLRVPNGSSPPCDGIVVEGETKFDESSLTGESRLISKSVNDEVFTGTINRGSPILIQSTRLSGSSMLDQVIKAVREGQTKRAPIERFADVITSYFVPIVTYLAIITWIIWLSLGISGTLPREYLDTDVGGWSFWSLQFAIAVFVVACPCGVGLAAPTALFVGSGLAAKYGILVKGGGEAFQEASHIDCIVFDKTGTLTKGGQPAITDHKIFSSENSMDKRLVYATLLTLEESSKHPIAEAIVSFAKKQGGNSLRTSQVDEIPGKGMKGIVYQDDREYEVILGNEALMNDFKVAILRTATTTLQEWQSQGKSVALLAVRPKATDAAWCLTALLAVSDPVRPEAIEIIKALHKRGIDVWMLSGDNQTTANVVGKSLGIPFSNIIAGALPSQKADKIRDLQQSQYRPVRPSLFKRLWMMIKGAKPGRIRLEKRPTRAIVAMVGDGINDSPALTSADVGIAIGSGSDIAISSAEFVLISAQLTTILTLIDLSRKVFRRVKLNFGWALIYNILAVPIAGGCFYAIKTSSGTHIRLDPVWASLAMALSSISVVTSSLLLRTRLPFMGFRPRRNAT
jgi:P-type Cu+ transporter